MMRPKIIAVDYDGTLEVGGKMNRQLISRLKAEQMGGSVVILWTCRSGKRLQEAVSKLLDAGFKPNLVNANHPAGARLMGHDSRKVYADVYIDDHNMLLR